MRVNKGLKSNQAPQQLASPSLLNTDAAGAYLNVQAQTLEAWRYRGDGPRYVKIGRLVKYRLSDLDAFIESNLRRNTSEDR